MRTLKTFDVVSPWSLRAMRTQQLAQRGPGLQRLVQWGPRFVRTGAHRGKAMRTERGPHLLCTRVPLHY